MYNQYYTNKHLEMGAGGGGGGRGNQKQKETKINCNPTLIPFVNKQSCIANSGMTRGSQYCHRKIYQ